MKEGKQERGKGREKKEAQARRGPVVPGKKIERPPSEELLSQGALEALEKRAAERD